MNVLERVREVNAGASLSESRLADARSRLMDGIEANRTAEWKRLVRRPMFLIVGAVAGVAAVTAAAVVINQPAPPAPRVEAVPVPTVGPREPGQNLPKPDPTTGTGVTEIYPGTTPQAGQYLRVRATSESLLYMGQDGVVFQWRFHDDRVPVSALLVRDESAIYGPADRAGEWISLYGPTSQRVQFFAPDPGAGDESSWDAFPADSEVRESRNKGGLAGDVIPALGSSELYSSFPRDPRALLDFLRTFERAYDLTDEQRDEAAVDNAFNLLRSNLAPADLRAALVAALDLSGLAQASPSGDASITYRMPFRHLESRTDTLTIRTATGWATEYTVRWDRADGEVDDVVPTTVPDTRMTYSVDIVDVAP